MTKQLKLIDTLIERAERRGVAIHKRRQVMYEIGDNRLREVYRVEKDGDIASLYHHGTQTVSVNVKEKKILALYGEGLSDADSMDAFLTHYGFENFSFGYRPVNGGFFALTIVWGETYEGEYGETRDAIERNYIFVKDAGWDGLADAIEKVQ